MKISKDELLKMGACTDGLGRFIKQTNNTDESVEVSSLVGGVNTYSDLMWLAGRTIDKSKIIRFACDCALINIELIKPYADQYDIIVNFLNNPTAAHAAYTADAHADAAANAAYAHAAARAARAASTAARAASTAAYNAASNAANAAYAAYAANAASTAASTAAHAAYTADAAAYAAAYAANAYAVANAARANDKVNELIIKLFED